MPQYPSYYLEDWIIEAKGGCAFYGHEWQKPCKSEEIPKEYPSSYKSMNIKPEDYNKCSISYSSSRDKRTVNQYYTQTKPNPIS